MRSRAAGPIGPAGESAMVHCALGLQVPSDPPANRLWSTARAAAPGKRAWLQTPPASGPGRGLESCPGQSQWHSGWQCFKLCVCLGAGAGASSPQAQARGAAASMRGRSYYY